MAHLYLETYRGENPGALNNPPVNEVLVSAVDGGTGYPVPLTAGGVWVQLLKPTQLGFIISAIEWDGHFHRVKLAVFEGTEVPVGLNLAEVVVTTYSGQGVALASLNLTKDIPKWPLPDADQGAYAEMMRIQAGGGVPVPVVAHVAPSHPVAAKKKGKAGKKR